MATFNFRTFAALADADTMALMALVAPHARALRCSVSGAGGFITLSGREADVRAVALAHGLKVHVLERYYERHWSGFSCVEIMRAKVTTPAQDNHARLMAEAPKPAGPRESHDMRVARRNRHMTD